MDKAQRIAIDLMTGGSESLELADSLKLFRRDGLYLGAWSLRGLTERIRKHLSGEFDDELLQLNEDEYLQQGESEQ